MKVCDCSGCKMYKEGGGYQPCKQNGAYNHKPPRRFYRGDFNHTLHTRSGCVVQGVFNGRNSFVLRTRDFDERCIDVELGIDELQDLIGSLQAVLNRWSK